MIKIDDHCIEDLDQMAIDHYEFLNPIYNWVANVGGISTPKSRLATHALISRIIRAKNSAKNLQESDFWDFFLDNQNAQLINCITGRPNELKAIAQHLDGTFGRNFLATRISYDESSLTVFGIEVASTFNYETLYRKKEACVLNSKKFNLNYCPYCNSSPVEVISYPIAGSPDEKKQALLELDHFYPKSRFPYLSLSFFNLIPGCSICNARLKLEKDFDIGTHFNPFDKRFHDNFLFSINNLKPKAAHEFIINAHSNTGHSAQALNDFKILERYNQNHKHILFDSIDFMSHRRKGVIASMAHQLKNVFPSVDRANDIAKRATGIPTHFTKINEKPFSKLKLDVLTQLGLL